MSPASPPKGKINRAPKDSEFDQAILIFAAALGIALVSVWIVWTNGQSAATSFMLNRDRVEVKGQGIVIKEHGSDHVVYYRFKDKEGKLWARINDRLAGRVFVLAKKTGVEKEFFDFLEDQTFSDLKILVHPKYPRFFASEADIPNFAFNFRLTMGGLAALLLAIFLGLRSIRKYKRLKAIAAYY